MEKNRDISLCGCQAYDIDNQGVVLNERYYPKTHLEILSCVHKINPILHPSYCIRREIFNDKKLRYPDYYLAEDWAFVQLLLSSGHILANHHEKLLYWRKNEHFYERRTSIRRGIIELRCSFRGLVINERVMSLQILFPFLRLIFRMMPVRLLERIYKSNLRQKFW